MVRGHLGAQRHVTDPARGGDQGLAGVMNFVVLTAALSGVNATLYAAMRLLRNLAANRRAPAVTNLMSRNGVPVGALGSIRSVFLLGTLLIFFAGASSAFEIVLGAVAVFVLFGWIAIFVSHLGFLRAVEDGRVPRPDFRASHRPEPGPHGWSQLGIVPSRTHQCVGTWGGRVEEVTVG